jgi:hypothetical protein
VVLHIGCDAFVPLSSVVAVLDVAARPDFLSELSPPDLDGCAVRSIGKGAVKSVIVTAEGERCVFFLSPISAQTLRKRAEGSLAKMR